MARLRAIDAIHVIGDDKAGLNWPGAVPDLDVGLLNDLLCEILSPQDTEHDAKEFRARGGVEALERGLIAPSRPPQSARPALLASAFSSPNRTARRVRTQALALRYHSRGKAHHQGAARHTVDTNAKPGPCGPGFDEFSAVGPLAAPSGDGADAGAHQADAVQVGLLAGVFFGALARLVALVEELDLLQFLEGFGQQRPWRPRAGSAVRRRSGSGSRAAGSRPWHRSDRRSARDR